MPLSRLYIELFESLCIYLMDRFRSATWN